MSAMKIKKGDMVKVIAGKDKNKEGKVLAVNNKDGKVLVGNQHAHKAYETKRSESEWWYRSSGRLH